MKRHTTLLCVAVILYLAPMALFAAPSEAEWAAMKALVEQQQQRIDDLEKVIKGKAAAAKPAGMATAAPSTAPAAHAATDAEALLNTSIKDINLDRPIAEVPAFVALDVSPNTVNHPTTPRQLAASLLNGVDRDGVLQTGLAVEVAPFQIFPHGNYNIDDYNAKGASAFFRRALYNTSLSLATTKASDDKDKAERLALGVHIVLMDDSDPRRYEQEILQQSVTQHPLYVPGANLTAEQNAALANADEAAKTKYFADAVAAWKRDHWAQRAWDVAWAPVWLSESGRADNLRYDGSTVWSTYAFGFEKDPFGSVDNRLQLLIQGRYRQGEHVTDPNDATRKGVQDTIIAAGRIRYGTADFNGSAEAAYLRTWGGFNGSGDAFRYSIGLERKIANNLWFNITTGQDFGGGRANTNDLFALGAFRFGTSDTPNFDPQPAR